MVFDERNWLFVSSFASVPVTRHQRITLAMLALGLSLATWPATTLAATPYTLHPFAKAGQVQRVRVILEVTGELIVHSDAKNGTKLPLKVQGELLYDERALLVDDQKQCRKSVRFYREARADFQVAESNQRSCLADEHRLSVAEIAADSLVMFSPCGPLTREELELLEVQGSSLVLPQLLPAKEVGIGDEWPHSNATAAALLGLDAVSQSDLRSTLRSVEGSTAILDLEGTVAGSVRGIASDVHVRGKYNYDLNSRGISWLTVSVSEKRAAGHAEPGFDVTARLRVAIAPSDPCPELQDESLEALSLEASPGATLLSFPSAAGKFQLLHSRPWRVMVDRPDVTILRMVDQGDLIAQCNASRLPDLASGQRVSMEAFQADIQRALAESFGKFLESSETTTETGLRVLRVVASGMASELPIQWTYYHVSNADGQQVAFVFTLDARLLERFAEADQTMVSSLAFSSSTAPPPAASAATPAAGDSASRPRDVRSEQPRR